jgi:hypothetical protein
VSAWARILGIDASNFHTRIILATGHEKRAREAIEDFARQVPLVEMGAGRWVVAKNIIGVAPIPEKRTNELRESGNGLNHDFKSAVETIAGTVWSTATPEEVMRRQSAALRQRATTAQPA